MSVENIGDREGFIRFLASIALVPVGIMLPFFFDPLWGVLGGVLCWVAAYLLFKSAMSKYCPIHNTLGIDTRGWGR